MEVIISTVDLLTQLLDSLQVGRAVQIAGTPTVGSTLTAALPDGWYAESFQWTRNDVDIEGAVSSTYTLQSGDAGAVISCRVVNIFVKATGLTVEGAVSEPVTVYYLVDEVGQYLTDENGNRLIESQPE